MRRSSQRRPRVGSFHIFNAILLLLVVAGTGFFAGVLSCANRVLPGRLNLAAYQPRLTTEIFSTERQQDGGEKHTLLARVFKEGEDREAVELREIPVALRQATVAIEDHRFHQHRGISPRDMLRAAWANLRAGHITQGASTITQQVARNIWLTQAKTYERKLKEIVLALALERTYSKDEILEMYLNEVYYGHGAYGVQVAAKMFFGKKVADLDLAECALLAGLPQSPSRNSPYNHPQVCKQRRHQVLMAMVHQGHITPEQAREADEMQIQSNLMPLKPRGVAVIRAPHFTHLVIRKLCEDYGVDVVYQSGLRVYTTLDMRLQEVAGKELTEMVESLRRQGRIRGGLVGQGALACVDVHSGAVLAMVGGVGPYEKLQYNRAHPGPPQYGRQPGSSFKPYVWATAFESGYGPGTQFSAEPIAIRLASGKWWRPKNYTPRHGGNYTLRNALAQSVNLVSVRLVQAIGADKVVRYAARIIGIPEQRLQAVPSIALGVCELSPLEQASGYAVFASGGIRYERQFVRRIENYKGDLLVATEPRPTQVLRRDTCVSMVSIMRSVVTSGTGRRAAIPGYRKVCGKTGTTQKDRDAWWVGYTPDLACAVWVGNEDDTPMHRGAGGQFCAPVFREFIRKAIEILGCNGDFPSGPGVVATKQGVTTAEQEEVEICLDSGGLATPWCPRTATRKLKEGEEPPPPCTLHGPPVTAPTSRDEEPSSPAPGEAEPEVEMVTVPVCVESGGLATEFCPQTVMKQIPKNAIPKPCRIHGPAPAPVEPEPEPPAPAPANEEGGPPEE